MPVSVIAWPAGMPTPSSSMTRRAVSSSAVRRTEIRPRRPWGKAYLTALLTASVTTSASGTTWSLYNSELGSLDFEMDAAPLGLAQRLEELLAKLGKKSTHIDRVQLAMGVQVPVQGREGADAVTRGLKLRLRLGQLDPACLEVKQTCNDL